MINYCFWEAKKKIQKGTILQNSKEELIVSIIINKLKDHSFIKISLRKKGENEMK
jgi:hypothetical protein